jgi:hypothetical protein
MDTEILRKATTDEKKDFIEVGSLTLRQRFMKILHQKEQEATRAHKPFARNWAYDDFQDKCDALAKRMERERSDFDIDDVKLADFKFDWDKYTDLKNFEELAESEVVEDKLIDGMRTSYVTGKWKNYRVKGMKYGISVFIPRVDANTGKAEKAPTPSK